MDVLKAFLYLLAWLLVTVTAVTFRLLRAARGLAVRSMRGASDTFGSARWATLWELLRGGVLGGNGLIVGKSWGRFLRCNLEGYALLFAPARSGKGVGVVVPNLLSLPDQFSPEAPFESSPV
jgi:type IV secretion system protein VirD4